MKTSEWIISPEKLVENSKKAMLIDKLNEEEKTREKNDKRFILIFSFILTIILTIAITQLFLIKNIRENEKTTTICRGGILEACVTKAK